jgi:hypothetical protein
MEETLNKLAEQEFTELLAARDHYCFMIENLRITMLDGLKKIPEESLQKNDQYKEYLRLIEIAFDRKMESFSITRKSRFVS